MITFQRRNLSCWSVCEDVNREEQDIPVLEFETEQDVIDYVYETLPFTQTDEYNVEIKDDVVMWWTVMGFIERK